MLFDLTLLVVICLLSFFLYSAHWESERHRKWAESLQQKLDKLEHTLGEKLAAAEERLSLQSEDDWWKSGEPPEWAKYE